jgi:ADP-ribose pyrophosphatase YjhB (NUDIX family)
MKPKIMNLKEEVQLYQPYNEQEEKDKALLLRCLEKEDNLFTRDNDLVHLTASCWITNKSMDKVLMCYHKIYDSWSWLGGHADGEKDLLKVALKEAKEESGLENIKPYDGKIFSLESLTVDGHIKRGVYVSSHIHLNVTYLLVADEEEELKIKEDENSGLRWFTLDEAIKASSEPWFVSHIYPKLNAKLREMK